MIRRAFHPQPDEAWRDFVARYAPHHPATLGTAARLTAGPVAQLLARHARAAVAAVRAYRSAVK